MKATLRIHAHDTDGRCVHIDKSHEIHEHATARQLIDIGAEFVRRLPDSLAIEEWWMELDDTNEHREEVADDGAES